MQIINFIKKYFISTAVDSNGNIAHRELFIPIKKVPIYNYPKEEIVGYGYDGFYFNIGYHWVDGK